MQFYNFLISFPLSNYTFIILYINHDIYLFSHVHIPLIINDIIQQMKMVYIQVSLLS